MWILQGCLTNFFDKSHEQSAIFDIGKCNVFFNHGYNSFTSWVFIDFITWSSSRFLISARTNLIPVNIIISFRRYRSIYLKNGNYILQSLCQTSESAKLNSNLQRFLGGYFDKLTDPLLIFWVVITGEVLVVVVTEVGEVRAATVMLVGDVLVTWVLLFFGAVWGSPGVLVGDRGFLIGL